MPVLERKLVHKIMSYWQLSLSKTRAFCCGIRLFLSNSGRCMSHRVTTCWAITWPDKVLIFLPLDRSLSKTPMGRLDFLMRQQEAPESKRMQNNHLLWIGPMVFTVQIVAGVSFLGMIFGPWKQYLMLSLKNVHFKQGLEAFPTESSSVVSHMTVLFVILAEESELKGNSLCMLHETELSSVSSSGTFNMLLSIVLRSGNETLSSSPGTKTHTGTLGLRSMLDSVGKRTYSRLLWAVHQQDFAQKHAMRSSTWSLRAWFCSFLTLSTPRLGLRPRLKLISWRTLTIFLVSRSWSWECWLQTIWKCLVHPV